MAGCNDETDLRLIADGRTIRPIEACASVARFALPARSVAVRIVSRSVVPASADPDGVDLRRLGVSVRHIVFRSPHLDLDVPPGDDSFIEGWHAPENGHRWTDGSALVPVALLRAFDEPFTLELHLNPVQLRFIIA